MPINDLISVVVQLDEEDVSVYDDIARSVSPKEHCLLHVSENPNNKEDQAKKVAEAVGEKNALVIGTMHYNMTFCHDGLTAVIFDAHNDSYQDWEYTGFYDGGFLLYRAGQIHIIGTNVHLRSERIKTYPDYKVKSLLNKNSLEEKLPDRIVLSLDIDVLPIEETKAHGYVCSNLNLPKNVARFFTLRYGITKDELFELTAKIVKGRSLPVVNIAGYQPTLEQPPYHTAELIKEWLQIVVNNAKS